VDLVANFFERSSSFSFSDELYFTFKGCLISGMKNFGVSHRMFHEMLEKVFGY
jgi:hypothetical protein